MKPDTIVFIHGMFVNNQCWEEWINYFTERGYTCIAPSWNLHNKPVEQLKKEHPNNELGKLTLDEVLATYENTVKSLNKPPILIGHSMGGLIVQMLLNRGYGACGIVIDSAPPTGVFTMKWSFLRSNLPVINPFKGDEPYLMSFKHFQYSCANTLTLSDQQKAYNKFIVPESRNIARSSATIGKIDFTKIHSPLLFIAGSEDRIIPASLNRNNFEKYKNSESKTDFKEFIGRGHSIIGEKGWKEVAEFVADWIKNV